jgi:cytochrome c oxidase subunit IV
MSYDHHADTAPATVAHVVSWRLLATVWAALVLLTIATVAATWVDLGRMNLVVALGIATLKGTLVLLYFMHLRWDRPFNAVVLVVTLLFLALFISLALIDTQVYQPELIPDYAPGIRQ